MTRQANPANILTLLSNSPLFSEMSSSEVELIVSLGQCLKKKDGEVVFWQDTQAIGFYVVLYGQIKLFKENNDGKQIIMRVVKAPQTLAEAAIFSGHKYPASAQSIGESGLFFLPKDTFLELISQQPQLALNMLATLSKLLRKLTSTLEQISLDDVPVRLARYLLEQADHHEATSFHLPLSKSQLASHLGTISETLSRVLRKFKNAHVVREESQREILVNRELLQKIIAGDKNIL